MNQSYLTTDWSLPKDDIERLKQEYQIHCEQAAYCKLQAIAAAERLLEEFNKWDSSVSL